MTTHRELIAETVRVAELYESVAGAGNSLTLLLRSLAAALESREVEPEPVAWQPIDQRTEEDCERCCWAMMLGLPYEQVPDFLGIWKTVRIDERRAWLRARGLDYLQVSASTAVEFPNAYCIAGVDSPTGHEDGHAVFGKTEGGKFVLLHDPSPKREDSGAVPFDLTYFVPPICKLTPLYAAPVVPDGFVLVPVIPTQAMIDAALAMPDRDGKTLCTRWTRMLAAAPDAKGEKS